ncbi:MULTISPECIES: spore coat protein [unclassified Clostridium]|uniref:spore coat protein n=1 Tax=unclassified Clostridium TaxID=2614128 RepID=UPI000821217B|nr:MULTISPECIES: spore coat protein [unclassified Clostridium]SCJ68914.1 Spore coat protein F precursor [uncultured Clostridium sp.]
MNENPFVQLTEQDMLTDLLGQEKQIVGLYSVAITEASTPELRQVLSNNFTNTTQDQYQTFDYMQQKGFYKIKQAQAQDIDQAKQTYCKMENELTK